VHKYMTFNSTFYSFEFEIRNYETTAGSRYVTKLHYVVTHTEVNRGLRIEYLSAESLNGAHLTQSEKYRVVVLLLDALSNLEAHRYCPQNLKLANILLSADKQILHIIDLGAGTEGMYRVESEGSTLQGKMNGRDMYYMLGM